MIESVVVIPALNPTEKLEEYVEELITARFKRIVVVDDGSDMEYRPIFSKIERRSECAVLQHAVNLGKGRALKTAFNYILNEIPEAGCVITVDADGQHRLPDIEKVGNAYEGERQLILGSRQFSRDSDGKKIPLRSKFGNQITKVVFNFLCGINISDTQTGLRVYPRKILPDLMEVAGERYEYETNVLLYCHDSNIRFQEVPIQTVYENNNETSHFHPIRDSLKIYGVIIKYIASSFLAVLVDNLTFLLLSGHITNYYALTYVGRACAAIINFSINKKIVFKKKGNLVIQALRYLLLLTISGTISAVSVTWLVYKWGWKLLPAKLFVELILFFFNFYAQNKFVFKKEEK
ncbi:MAG: bifunctional glycosyltransferase family 2/GtrA family protein [Butyrivibrio sp.]|nr:bifunctional glycosyltransferase family 2/GtrA family protein [Butyrivibrio sp.]